MNADFVGDQISDLLLCFAGNEILENKTSTFIFHSVYLRSFAAQQRSVPVFQKLRQFHYFNRSKFYPRVMAEKADVTFRA